MAGVFLYIVCVLGYLHICQGVRTETANKAKEISPAITTQFEFVAQQLAKMDAKMSALNQVNSQLHAKVAQISEENAELNDQLEQQKQKFQLLHDVEKRMNVLQRQMTQLKDENSMLKDKLNLQNTFISFSAYATFPRDYGEGDTVLFDGVINNYGSHYDPVTSVFTCPYSGYYMFALNVYTAPGYLMFATISLDGARMFFVESDSNSINDNAQASNFIVILCDEGSQVSVVCPNSSTNRMYGSPVDKHSTFVGTLLQHLVPVE